MKTGDTVYLKAVGNRARNHKSPEIAEYVIDKIGRKYFDVRSVKNKNTIITFEIVTKRQRTNYEPDWKLYFSKQEILDEEETKRITSNLRERFGRYGTVDLTLDQLRRIEQIINE
ncbi:hypothetical protein MKY95_19370 [Paenibacillus sp. FSL P4-0176]|uniref:beta barrel domain-containing protein n=1 Tax=Paenibacillus sp. FSL P4-0176 TaxID=2921631 RepID=UPI0030D419C8